MHTLDNEFWFVMTGVALLMAGTILWLTIYSDRGKGHTQHQGKQRSCTRCGRDVRSVVGHCPECGETAVATNPDLQQNRV